MNLANLTRREALRYVAVAPFAYSIPAYAQGLGSIVVPFKPSACTTSFEQVRAGAVSPQDYLKEREECIPELVVAKNSGQLKGLLFEPTDQELQILLKRELKLIARNDAHLQELVNAAVENYNDGHPDVVGRVAPGLLGVVGRNVPMYIVFKHQILLPDSLYSTEADLKTSFAHEVQHVEDFYRGIRLGDLHLKYPGIVPPRMSVKFFEQLGELRATHRELEDVLTYIVRARTIPIGNRLVGAQFLRYIQHWNYVKSEPSTSLEKKTSKLQLDEFADMVPEKKDGLIIINFKLDGKIHEIAAKVITLR
ncbi:hypothetical protein HYY71_02925 [Candidatus Woesearchaeota archaeon]|nr:hypothetical protein [Candidatus Woesearchaeota archaeon]